MWHVVRRFARSLSFKFTEAFDEYRKSVSGITAEDPRWQDCLGHVEGSFGMPFGLLFVDEAFEGKSKKSVRKPQVFHPLFEWFMSLKDWLIRQGACSAVHMFMRSPD